MPRYAKGSFEHAVYQDMLGQLQNEAIERKAVSERRNSVLSRAHRMEIGLSGIPPSEKVRGIKVLCRLHDNRWITDENFLNVVGDILKGE